MVTKFLSISSFLSWNFSKQMMKQTKRTLDKKGSIRRILGEFIALFSQWDSGVVGGKMPIDRVKGMCFL